MGTVTKNIKITIGDKEYEDYYFTNFVLTQDLLKPNELRFTMQNKSIVDRMEDKDFPVPKELLGAEVSLEIETMRLDKEGNEKNETLIFKGIVFIVNVYRADDMYSEQLIDVTAYSHDYLLMDHPHCYSYEDMYLEDIVEATLKPYSFPNDIDPIVKTRNKIPYTVQYNETNYEFLIRLAQRYGQWMYHNGEKWIFGGIKHKDKIMLDSSIIDYNFQVDLMHHTLKHAHHNYLNYENPTKSNKDVSGFSDKGLHPLTDEAMDKSESLFTKETFQNQGCGKPEENDSDELEVSIEAQLYGEKAVQTICAGETIRADLTIGSIIEILDHYNDEKEKKVDIDHDDLLIVQIVHSCTDNGDYKNNFRAISANSEYPPYHYSDTYPRTSAQRAKVKDNKDPEKLGRIRVQFLWQEEQDDTLMTPWIRIAQPYGGKDKGFYFIPEIDEEVMVDFENGNAEKPYVVGTLYHGIQYPDYMWANKENDIKAIRTRSGHTIEINDKDKNGFIRIYDFEKENYVLTFSTDDKLIKLESTGNIELFAQNDILMEAKHDVIIKAANFFEASGDKQAVLHSDKTTTVQSKEHTDIIGDPTLVHSNSDLTLESMGATKMEANSTINVEAQATTTVKGAMVQIN